MQAIPAKLRKLGYSAQLIFFIDHDMTATKNTLKENNKKTWFHGLNISGRIFWGCGVNGREGQRHSAIFYNPPSLPPVLFMRLHEDQRM